MTSKQTPTPKWLIEAIRLNMPWVFSDVERSDCEARETAEVIAQAAWRQVIEMEFRGLKEAK